MASLLEVFEQIPDHRRAQAKQYPLPQVLLFCILGIMSGAISYRKLHSFIRIRFALLNRAFPSRMRKPPSYTQLREILVGLDKDDLEAAFRQHAGALANLTGEAAIAADAKALRGSFDAVDDRNAALVLSLFVAGERIILAHRAIDEKSNEIPALQALIAELGLQGKLFTADAEHCQKKTFAQTQACGSQLLVQVKDNQPSLATALAACRRRRHRSTCTKPMTGSRMGARRTAGSKSSKLAPRSDCRSGSATRWSVCGSAG